MARLVWRTGTIAALALATVTGLGSDAAGRAFNACRSSSDAAFRSCKGETQGDKWLASGKCDNVPDRTGRKACNAQVAADAKDAADTCKARRKARQAVCERLGAAAYVPVIDLAKFVGSTVIDNPFFPLTPGTTFIYEGQTAAGLEHSEFFVTHNTKVILGVTCVEVHDTVKVNDEPTEDTLDWFAEDAAGNVWYFGENSKELVGGLVVGVEGSWTAGVDGAEPGIIMEAHPAVGDFYRQEFLLGEAEDLAEVVSLTESVTVQGGSCDSNCLKTEETTPQEPDVAENKFYKAGVGNLRTVDLDTGETFDLVQITTE